MKFEVLEGYKRVSSEGFLWVWIVRFAVLQIKPIKRLKHIELNIR